MKHAYAAYISACNSWMLRFAIKIENSVLSKLYLNGKVPKPEGLRFLWNTKHNGNEEYFSL